MGPLRLMPREFVPPSTRPRYAPDRPVDVEHYKIAVALFPDQRRITGTTAVTARVLAPTIKRLCLDAIELDITSVREGTTVRKFSHDGKIVTIDLGDARREG